MKKTTLIRFVESLILLPGLTMSSMPVGAISQAVVNAVNTPSVMFSQKQTDEAVDPEALALQAKADSIDAYFKAHDMPLDGMGMKMVLEAKKNDIDWRLLPAISVRESTGGKFACKKATYNSFGWGSCKIGFESNEKAIEMIAHNLGGNNPKTERHYEDKTTKQILHAYNPPSIVPRYAEQVIAIMNTIGLEDKIVESDLLATTIK